MYIEQIKELMSRCSETDRDSLVEQMGKLTEYVNRIIEEAPLLMRAGINMDQQDYVNYAQRLYAARNRIHDIACEGVDAINNIAKRNHMREVFPDFTLEKANDPTRTVIYNGETHRKVNEFSAIICNEFYHEGSYALEQYLMDNIAKQQDIYKPLSKDDVIRLSTEYEIKHNKLDLRQLLDQTEKDQLKLTCFDGTEIKIWTDKDNIIGQCNRDADGHIYSADFKVTAKEYNKLTMGDASLYIDKNGVGFDAPVSVLTELATRHGGIKEYEELDLTKEKEQHQEKINGMLKTNMNRSIKDKFQILEGGQGIYEEGIRPLKQYSALIKEAQVEKNGMMHDTDTSIALKLAALSELGRIQNCQSPEKLAAFFDISEQKVQEHILRETPVFPITMAYQPQENNKDILQIQIPGVENISIDINEIVDISKDILSEQEAEKFLENTQELITNHATLNYQPEQILDEHVSTTRTAFDGLALIENYQSWAALRPQDALHELTELRDQMGADLVKFESLDTIENIEKEMPWLEDQAKDIYLVANIVEYMPEISYYLDKLDTINAKLEKAEQKGEHLPISETKAIISEMQQAEDMLNKEYLQGMIKLIQDVFPDPAIAGSVLTEELCCFAKNDQQIDKLTACIKEAVNTISQEQNKALTGQLYGDD